jgi:hypothetical protein
LTDIYILLPSLACAVFKLHRASRKIPVVHSERETPLPIPNRAVKPFSADGTWGATPWESRSPPVLHMTDSEPPSGGSSSFWGGIAAGLGPGRPRVGVPLNFFGGECRAGAARAATKKYKTLHPYPRSPTRGSGCSPGLDDDEARWRWCSVSSGEPACPTARFDASVWIRGSAANEETGAASLRRSWRSGARREPSQGPV